MDRLKPQFHADIFFPSQPGEQCNGFLRQTVRPGSDCQTHDILRFHRRPEHGFHPLNRGIGIGKGLEIGDVFSAGAFFLHPLLRLGKLVRHAFPRGGELSAARAGAEPASADAQSPIPVGAGEAAVQRQLIDLAAKTLLVILIGGAHGKTSCV